MYIICLPFLRMDVQFAIFLLLLECCLLFQHIAIFLLDRFPIIEPDPGHTKLRLSREGLEAIEKITTPIAAVAVGFALVSGISYNQSFFRNKMLSSLTQFYGSLSLRVIAWKFLLLCLRVCPVL